ncbi:MAG: hypothetical protein ACPG3X_05285, partial [Opitutales bacterium]
PQQTGARHHGPRQRTPPRLIDADQARATLEAGSIVRLESGERHKQAAGRSAQHGCHRPRAEALK